MGQQQPVSRLGVVTTAGSWAVRHDSAARGDRAIEHLSSCSDCNDRALTPGPVLLERAGVEATALRHLVSAHPDESSALRSWVPPCWRGEGAVVQPLGLDRYGFRLRIEDRHGSRDVRVPFSVPVSSPDALGPAVHRLLCAAR